MADLRTSGFGGIPYGDSAGRPSSPGLGRLYSNGQESRLELYTNLGWQNIVQETPSVVSISGVYNQSAASNSININGTNFAAGALAYAVGNNGVQYAAQTTTLNSIVSITAVFSGLSPLYEPYGIKVVNPSNLYGVLNNALYINETPIWATSAGSLGTFIEGNAISVSVSATDPESTTITYSSTDLPAWLSLNSSTGVITGTAPLITSTTTYSFSISASDSANSLSRNFSITITDRAPTWTTAATLPTFTRNSAYSTTLVATDDSGVAPTYSLVSGSLPTGLSLNSSTGVISGTPTSSSNATFTIRATDNGGSTVDRTFTMPNSSPTWSTTSPLTNATRNVAYNNQLVATDDSGTNPTYSLPIGVLPTGLTLSSTGVISGTPTVLEQQTFTVRATDANGGYTDREFTLLISSGIVATGGTVYTSGGYTYHKFTGSGTFQCTANPANLAINVLLVGGGASGGNDVGGGGGAGGILYNSSFTPTVTSYSVVVGAGGAATVSNTSSASAQGGNSTFGGTMTAFGGGGGANWQVQYVGQSGGCGGGAAGYTQLSGTNYGSSTQTSNGGGTGYGNRGGAGNSTSSTGGGGGGGGAGAAGGDGIVGTSGNGGVGLNTWSTWATATSSGSSGYFAGGGGGAADWPGATAGYGGLGGGGAGGTGSSSGANPNVDVGVSGTANTGGGGGGSNSYPGGAGGSGIVIVRYAS